MPDLAVHDITKQFPTRSEPLVVLRGVSLALSAGENLAVLGPSGSGKSTLLHILGTLDRPTSGTCDARGRGSVPARRAAAWPASATERIGFVFQDHHLLPQCSVLENVLVPTLAEGAAASEHDRAGPHAAGPRRPGGSGSSIARPSSPAASGSGSPSPGR